MDRLQLCASILLALAACQADGAARSVASEPESPQKAASSDAVLSAYRVTGGTAVPLGSAINANESLLFAYDQHATPPHPFMLVVGVDQDGGLHWFTPEETIPDASPRVAAGHHFFDHPVRGTPALAPGDVAIYGIFSPLPLTRNDVVAAVSALRTRGFKAASPPPLPLSNTLQTRISTRVM